MKTLIVDNDLTSCNTMSDFLIPYGRCDIAVNGNEGLQCFNLAMEENKPYDLICIEILMSDVDGMTAIEKIRRMEMAAGIKAAAESKVIIMSALDDPKTVMSCFKNGATTYLVKPIGYKHLLEQLHTLKLILSTDKN